MQKNDQSLRYRNIFLYLIYFFILNRAALVQKQ